MRFRRSAPSVLIVAVIIVIAGLTFMSARLFSGLTASVEASQFQLIQAILETNLRNSAEQALARADILASLAATKQAVADKDRERLVSEYSEMFASQKERRGVDQVQFHVPPSHSLLRLHNPSRFGDDLARFRPMVMAVNRERATRQGLAIAFGGPAIFGVTPIQTADGRHVGSVEFGLDFAPLLDRLRAAYGLEFTLFVEEKPLRDFATGLNPAILSDQNRVGRFVRFHTTNANLMKDLVGEADISVVNEPTRYTRHAQDVPYGVLLMPLRDNAGDAIGVVAAAMDFSRSRAAAGRSLVWQICIAIFAIVLLAGAIIVVVRGFLLRPLSLVSDRLRAAAAGEHTVPVLGSDKFCAELQPLVDLHERIRKYQARTARDDGRIEPREGA